MGLHPIVDAVRPAPRDGGRDRGGVTFSDFNFNRPYGNAPV